MRIDTSTELVRIIRMWQSVIGRRAEIDQDTIDQWMLALPDATAADIVAAIRTLASTPARDGEERRFYGDGLAPVVAEVARIRRARPRVLVVPNVDPDDVVGYAAESRAIDQAQGDGTFDAAEYTRTGRPLVTAVTVRGITRSTRTVGTPHPALADLPAQVVDSPLRALMSGYDRVLARP